MSKGHASSKAPKYWINVVQDLKSLLRRVHSSIYEVHDYATGDAVAWTSDRRLALRIMQIVEGDEDE